MKKAYLFTLSVVCSQLVVCSHRMQFPTTMEVGGDTIGYYEQQKFDQKVKKKKYSAIGCTLLASCLAVKPLVSIF